MFGITPRSLRCKSESGWPEPQAKAMSNWLSRISPWQSINHDSAVNSINIAYKRGMLSVKNILDYIQNIYEGLNILFVTFSHFRIVCQSSKWYSYAQVSGIAIGSDV